MNELSESKIYRLPKELRDTLLNNLSVRLGLFACTDDEHTMWREEIMISNVLSAESLETYSVETFQDNMENTIVVQSWKYYREWFDIKLCLDDFVDRAYDIAKQQMEDECVYNDWEIDHHDVVGDGINVFFNIDGLDYLSVIYVHRQDLENYIN